LSNIGVSLPYEKQIKKHRFWHFYPCLIIHFRLEHLNQFSMSYTPKNNWYFRNRLNDCFTSEEFEKIEECYTFSGEDIFIKELACDIFGDFHFDFTFMGVEFKGKRKLDSVNRALWSEETAEYIAFEMSLELLSHDAMNDVYQNHEIYK
jgi:hypothetical protein